MSRRTLRLVVVPAILLVAVSGLTFFLAGEHPAKRAASPAPIVRSVLIDVEKGRELFAERCAGCHGEDGAGGGVGPTLAGSGVSREDAATTIENGSGVMPASLVEGQDLEDVLGYLETIAR
jgi:cytochrome c551